jgi:hypothetical protein
MPRPKKAAKRLRRVSMAKLTKSQQQLLTDVHAAAQTDLGYLVSDRTPDVDVLKAMDKLDIGTLPDTDKVALRLPNSGAATNLPNGQAAAGDAKWLSLVKGMPPPPAQKGGKREEEYPWSEMDVNDSFLVPVTAKTPKPWDSFATSVSSTNRRYSVDSPTGEKRKNRKGEMVTVRVPVKKFTLRRVYQGMKYENGYVEVADGARIFRVQ